MRWSDEFEFNHPNGKEEEDPRESLGGGGRRGGFERSLFLITWTPFSFEDG